MKKPNDRWRWWHRQRARNQARKKFVRPPPEKLVASLKPFKPFKVELWDGTDFRPALCVAPPTAPPQVLCLSDNRDETLRFLELMRSKMTVPLKEDVPKHRTWVNEQPGKRRNARLHGYSDFASIERLGTSAAVVLASEYDRARRIIGQSPPTVNIHKWSETAFRTLFQLGFFEVIGLTESLSDRFESVSEGDTLVLPMMSGTNGDELRKVSEAIVGLTSFINNARPVDPKVLRSLNTAIGEAMINVARHAYMEPFSSTSAYVPRWWFTAAANRKTRMLTAVLFDHGASIPVTLPYKEASWFERLTSSLGPVRLRTNAPADTVSATDCDVIRYAMREGTTQTDEPGRGIGLPQMKALISEYGAGKLTVVSRGGLFSFAPDAGEYVENLPTAIGGTLIEWEIEVPWA